MPTVFVIGQDWTLRSLVRAELRERGVEALGMETPEDAGRALAAGTMPSVVVLDVSSDAGEREDAGLPDKGVGTDETRKPGATSEDTDDAALRMLAKRVPLLIVASHMQAASFCAAADAAAVLYKPVSVGEVVARVEELLKGVAA